MKVIALVDCDSFFVSCEQATNPELKNKPVCVISGKDGCVISRSREAKAVGVKMGEPYFMASKEFPDVIYINADHRKYSDFSNQVMSCLRNYSPDVEVYSIDEAYIDLSGTRKMYKKSYTDICKMIRKDIKEKTDIYVSIGLSNSKILAKLASDKAKKTGGIYVISKYKLIEELKRTPISDISGIGKNNYKFCQKWGILTGYDFIRKTDSFLKSEMGKTGLELKYELMGKSVIPLKTIPEPPKSIQKTSAISGFTEDINVIKEELSRHIRSACKRLRGEECKTKFGLDIKTPEEKTGGKCSTVGVMLRTKDFQVYTLSENLSQPTNLEITIIKTVYKLLNQIYKKGVIYRSSGIILTNLTYNNEKQLFLFDKTSEKDEKLAKCIDNIETKYGKNSIKTGFYRGK